MILFVTPAVAVQIEEANTLTCECNYIENYKVNTEDNINVYSFKNNNTGMGNGTGGLAPLETPSEPDGFSTAEKWIIGILTTVLLIFIYLVCRANHFINHYEYYFEQIKEVSMRNADDWGARGDALVEMMDQARVIGQWCPNMGIEIREIQQDLQNQYDQAYRLYSVSDNRYWQIVHDGAPWDFSIYLELDIYKAMKVLFSLLHRC